MTNPSAENPAPTVVWQKTSVASPMFYQEQPTAPQYAGMRAHPRYLVTRPLTVIPVLADGSPDVDHVIDGICVDISLQGMGLEVTPTNTTLPNTIVLGMETTDGSLGFITASIKSSVETGIGLRLGVRFYAPEKDLFRPERLTPCFNPQTFTFDTGLSSDALTKWTLLGVLRPMVMDGIEVCYQCESLVTYRRGCPACGSAKTDNSRLIHHFACAHVDFTPEFEEVGCMKCPKCRTKNLIIGTDFEYLDGPFRCLDCEWKGSELERIAQCLRCRLRFPAHRIVEKELIGYHVSRLDPLAFVPES